MNLGSISPVFSAISGVATIEHLLQQMPFRRSRPPRSLSPASVMGPR